MNREVRDYGLKGAPEVNLGKEFDNFNDNKENKKQVAMTEAPKLSQVPDGQEVIAMVGTDLYRYRNYRGVLYRIAYAVAP